MKVTKFGNIVREVKVNVDRDNNPYEFYIAGDHMDSEDLTIHRKGKFSTDDVGPAFTRIFKPGQILYGSRRTYLKKIAVADFEGICANTTFVLETKDDNVFLQSLLPFIMLSDKFTEWSVSHSKGSTNPYVLFSDLASYEFELPSLEEQRVLAEKLWAAYRLKESYKRLLAATDEMVKSQFIEMFGDVEKKPFVDVCISKGEYGSNSPADLHDTDKVSFVPMSAVSEDGHLLDILDEEYGKVKKGFTYFENNDVLFAKITPCMENGKGAIAQGLTNGIGMGSTEFHVLRPINEISSPYWLLALTQMPVFRERAAKNMSGTGGQKRVAAAYLEHFMVGVPSIEEQRHFEAIYKQADKSKFVGFKSQFIEMYRRAHKEMTLESVCTIMGKGITPKYVDSSSVVVINQACVHWDGQHLENVKYHNKNVPVKKRTLETGDVLLNATGNGTLGRCCVFSCPSDENQYVNDGHVIAISTDRSVILPEVLNSYLSLSDTQAEIYRQYVTGSTNQIDIVFTDIKKMTVPVPNMREQLQFVSTLQQADKSKYYN